MEKTNAQNLIKPVENEDFLSKNRKMASEMIKKALRLLEWRGTLNATCFRSPGRPWMLSGPESGNPGSVSGRQRPSLTFWSLLREKHFWAQKCLLGSFPAFWAPKSISEPEMHFSVPKSLLRPKGLHFHRISVGFISISWNCAFSFRNFLKVNCFPKIQFGLELGISNPSTTVVASTRIQRNQTCCDKTGLVKT